MRLRIVSLIASLLVLFNFVVAGTAQAQTLAQASTDKADFTTLTPEEKTDFFSKFKNLFKPSPEEIGDKINMKRQFKPSADDISDKIKTGMKMKEKYKPATDDIGADKKAKFKPTADEISEKIKAGLQAKEKFKPTADEITEKIKAKATVK